MKQGARIKTQPFEIEAKWRLRDSIEQNRLRGLLKKLGGLSKGWCSEINRLFDNPIGQLEREGKVLRLRFMNNETRALLTLKSHAKYNNGIKQCSELELEVTNGHAIELILAELGFSTTLEYLKIRETWQFNNTEIMFDKLSFGYFCEIEGPYNTIKEVSEVLGLDLEKCETRNYPTLMREYNRKSM